MSSSPQVAVEEPAEPSPGALRPILVLVIGTGIRWFGLSFYVVFILLFLHNDLHLSYILAGLIITVIGVGTVPLGQIGGGLSDRVGRRRMIVLSLAGESTGLALLAWGFSLDSLLVILGAILLSRSFAVTGSPSTYAYIADSLGDKLRARGLSWLRVAVNLGTFGGISVAGVLLTFISFGQLTALAALLVGAAATVNGIWLVPTARDLALKAKEPGSTRPTAAPSPSPLRWVGQTIYSSFRPIWSDRSLPLVMLASILMLLMLIQYAYAIPTFSHSVLGVPYPIVGAAVSLSGLIPVLTQVPTTKALSGRLLTRVGIWGALAYGASYLAFGLDATYRVELIPALFAMVIVITLAENLVFLPIFTLPLNIAPENARGSYSGTITMVNAFGNNLGALFAGVALTYASQPLVTWGILAAPAIPAILILAYLGSRISQSQNRV